MNDGYDAGYDWHSVAKELRAPFPPEDVEFLAKGKPGPSGKSQVVAYVDARCVQDRLDAVVGPGAWSFEWQPISLDSKGDVSVAKGTLTIRGVAKSDVGTASNFEASLGAVSHALKRAAVMWGIGRYLYDLEKTWIALDNGHISDAALARLRASLPRPDGAQPQKSSPARPTASPAASERPQPPQQPTRPQRPPAPSQRDAGRPTDGLDDEGSTNPPATEQQAKAIRNLCDQLGRSVPLYKNTYTAASRLIQQLTAAKTARDPDALREAFPAGQQGA